MFILKKFGAALLLAAISFPMWAAPAFSFNPGKYTFQTKAADNKSVVVQLYNLDKEYTLLQVEGRDGKVYFEKSIRKQNGFGIVLHLDELPEGSYILSVHRKDGVKSQVVRVEEDGLLLSQVVENE